MWLVYLLLGIVVAALAVVVLAVYLPYFAATLVLAAVIAGAVSALALLWAYLVTFTKVLVLRPASLTPPGRWPQSSKDADPAVLQYFYGPALADAWHIAAIAADRGRRQAKKGAEAIKWAFSADSIPWLTAPVGVGAVVGAFAGVAAAILSVIAWALVHATIVAVCRVLAQAIAAVLRFADAARLRIRGIRMVCSWCGEHVPYPAYPCPRRDCPRRHQDIRPGELGLVRRYCVCGDRLMTTLLLGAARMAACCPTCGEPLDHRPGEAPEVVIPFIGATGAGKTRLLISMVSQLQAWAADQRMLTEFGDTVTARELNGARDVLRSAEGPRPTASIRPRSHVVRIATARGRVVLHLLDPAGSSFADARATQDLRYLRLARTFVVVMDPRDALSLTQPGPAQRVPEGGAERSRPSPPDVVYHHVYQELARMGVALCRSRAAIVFSRADVIDADCGDVAVWADEMLGLGNLVRSARQNFGESRFFLSAAVMRPDGVVDESVAALMRWVLAGHRAGLP
jgi:hypothetical protein